MTLLQKILFEFCAPLLCVSHSVRMRVTFHMLSLAQCSETNIAVLNGVRLSVLHRHCSL